MKCVDLDVLDDVLVDSEFSEERRDWVSSCRYCAHYAHEGRRGGNCDSLNVEVQGSWVACSLAVSAFSEPPMSASVRSQPIVLQPLSIDALPHWIPQLQTHDNYAES